MVTDAAVKARTTLYDKAFATDRVMPDECLGWPMVVPVIVLILVVRRRILHE